MSFKTVQLFGGSIAADLPSTYADVSDIRQIPDHQEVYIDADGFTSIIVEILEREDKPDQDALSYHLEDLVEADAGKTKVISTAQAHLAKMPTGTSAYTLVAIAPPGEKQVGRANEPDFVAIYLTMLRLAEQRTDLLIVVNVPYIPGRYDPSEINQDAGQLGALGDHAQEIRSRLLQSFEIKDWNLFAAEQ